MEAVLEFEDIEFEELEGRIRVNFLRNYYFELDSSELSEVAEFRIEKNKIIFGTNEKRARNKFEQATRAGRLRDSRQGDAFAAMPQSFQGERTLVLAANFSERYCGQGQQITASLTSSRC